MAPPPKLTEADLPRVHDLVRAGLPYSRVGDILGIHKRTVMKYYADGRDLAEQGADPDSLPEPLDLYLRFYQTVEEASALAEKTMVSRIMDASETDWRAASWYLSRTNREHWGETEVKVRHSGAVATVNDGALTEAQAEDIRRRIFGLPQGED